MSEEARAFSAASFYQYLREGKLMGSRSKQTGKLFVPPRAICPDTFTDDMEWVALAGTGTLVAYTVIHFGLSHITGHDRDNPYCTGIVELDEGVRISTRITGVDVQQPAAIAIGMPVAFDTASVDGDPVLMFRKADA